MDYIESIGRTCGFDVEEDVLRIPSTKRVRISKYSCQSFFKVCSVLIAFNLKQVCQIGRNQNCPKQNSVEGEISKMLHNSRYKEQNDIGELESLNSLSSYHHDNTQTDQPQAPSYHDASTTPAQSSHVPRQFVPRSDTEPVRNCTKLARELLDEIVRKVAMELLSRPAQKQEMMEDEKEAGKRWRKGGKRCFQ